MDDGGGGKKKVWKWKWKKVNDLLVSVNTRVVE